MIINPSTVDGRFVSGDSFNSVLSAASAALCLTADLINARLRYPLVTPFKNSSVVDRSFQLELVKILQYFTVTS